MTPDVARAILKLMLLIAVFFAAILAMPFVTPNLGLFPIVLLFVAFLYAARRITGEPERKRKAQQTAGSAGASPEAKDAAATTPPRKPWTTPPIMPGHAIILGAVAFFGTRLIFSILLEPLGQSRMSNYIGLCVLGVVMFALDEIQKEGLHQQKLAAHANPTTLLDSRST